jgi:iron complex transport system substrate-binding protein
MRVFGFVSAASLLFAAPAGAEAPRRVASLKLCTDELLMMIGSPSQIASVTYLSRQEAETPLWKQALAYRKNDGTLLSVAPLAPDLILDMGGGAKDVARIGSRLGAKVLTLPYPNSLADIEASIRSVAAALGRRDRGEQLVRAIDQLKGSAPKSRTGAAWVGSDGRSIAPDGLGAEWMALAGFRQLPLAGDRLTLEQMLVDPPPLLLESRYRAGQYSRAHRWFKNPLVVRSRVRRVQTDGRVWTCMGPLMIGEILRLRREARL